MTIKELLIKKSMIQKELEYIKANSNDLKRIQELQNENKKCSVYIAVIKHKMKSKDKSQDK